MNTLEAYTITNPNGIEDECAKFVIDDLTNVFVLTDTITAGQMYTFSFWAKSDTDGRLIIFGQEYKTSIEWIKHTVIFVPNTTDLDIAFGLVGTYYIYHPKLEIGNKATDWTEAPEDVDQRIDDTAAGLHDKIIEQSTQIIQTNKEITQQALKTYVQHDVGTYITDVTNYYALCTVPEGAIIELTDIEDCDIVTDWSTEIPYISSNDIIDNGWIYLCLCSYELMTYSDGSIKPTSPVLLSNSPAEYFVENSGVYVTSITPYFGANNNETESPTEWDSSLPDLSVDNKYLWVYTHVLFNDDSREYASSKRVIGTYRESYSEFMESVNTQMSVVAGEIDMTFEKTQNSIEEIDGELQEKFTQLYKHISFSENGIIITSGENSIELQLDNDDGIIFSKNGEPFGRWDGVDFYTGNIIVEVQQRAQFGNFAFVPRSDGSLMFLKVGE